MANVLHLPKDHKVATIKVIPPPMPKDAEAIIERDGVLKLSYEVAAEPTPEFAEWAAEQNIPFTMHMTATGIIVEVPEEDHLLWIKMRWL